MNIPDLTIDDIRGLAQLEREMDMGIQSYVLVGGNRMSVSEGTMERLGLVSGQTASNAICIAICQSHIAEIETEIAIKNAQQKPDSPLG